MTRTESTRKSGAIVVISCAGSKKDDAGHFKTDDGRKVMFVADPAKAPRDSEGCYARPDDLSHGLSWRDRLVEYNDRRRDNPLGLLRAGRLYANEIYSRLVERYGLDGFYVLSAGWGLIRADFLTPNYDITFSNNADAWNRRKAADRWKDLNMLSDDGEKPVMFFGGKAYVPLFCRLTEGYRGERKIWTRSQHLPDTPGCVVRPYRTNTRTNWHYECVGAYLDGKLC